MSKQKAISVGCDHAGFIYKDSVITLLRGEGYTILDHGTDSAESTDYPDHIHPVGRDIECGDAQLGVVICGSGNGTAMTANKYPSVRAALCWTAELASLARSHNDANVLSIPARFIDEATALAMVRTFLETPFEGGRHARRVNKIAIPEASENC